MFAVNWKCRTLYKIWWHKMKRRYQELVEAGQNTYSKPYIGVSQEDWAWMIDNIWANAEKEVNIDLKLRKSGSFDLHLY